jgi:dolichol kinase
MERLIQGTESQYKYDIPVAIDLKTEIIRKSLHLLIALVPTLASIDRIFTLIVLGLGTLTYVFAEKARREGYSIFFISDLTLIASRDRDKDRFVIGPVTLGLGAMLALFLYPREASTIAIYALAFGDSAASLIGKTFGKLSLPVIGDKTLTGSLACFAVVLFFTFQSTNSFEISFIIALGATVLEALPTKDLDNLIIPVGTGFIASLLIHFF